MQDTYCIKVIARKQVIASAGHLSEEESKAKKKKLEGMIKQYQIKAKVKREVER